MTPYRLGRSLLVLVRTIKACCFLKVVARCGLHAYAQTTKIPSQILLIIALLFLDYNETLSILSINRIGLVIAGDIARRFTTGWQRFYSVMADCAT